MNVGIPHNVSASTVLNIIEVQFGSEKSFGDKRRNYSLNSVVSLSLIFLFMLSLHLGFTFSSIHLISRVLLFTEVLNLYFFLIIMS